jgi:DNA topoisomerase-1
MPKALVIVESPAKAKTINKYLGKDYVVKASLGHIKDLPKRDLAVDVDHDFEPHYEVIEGKKKLISELKAAAKKVDEIYLAADPDREGEAICYHLEEELRDKKGVTKIFRVMFNEITKKAVLKAFETPTQVNKTWWTRSSRAACSTGWWATRSRRYCGTRCGAVSPRAACRPLRSA